MAAKQKFVRLFVEVAVPLHVTEAEAVSQVQQGTVREFARLGIVSPLVSVVAADQINTDLAALSARVEGISKVVAEIGADLE